MGEGIAPKRFPPLLANRNDPMANQDDNLSQLRKRGLLRLLSGALTATIILCVSGLTGCGGGGGGNQPSQPSQPVIGLSGGAVSSSDGNATITFPSAVLGHDANVTLTPGSHPINVDTLDISSTPEYNIQFAGTSVAHAKKQSAHLSQPKDAGASSSVTIQIKNLPSFDNSQGIVYAYRSDISDPIILQSTFNPQSGTVTAQVPLTILHAHLDGTEENSGDFETVHQLSVGVAKSLSNGSNQVAGIDTFGFHTSSTAGASGNWTSGWPDSQSLAGHRVAIIIPGTWSDHNARTHLADYLGNLGYLSDSDNQRFFNDVLGIDYNTLASPDQTGTILASYLKRLIDAGARVYLFAHSQGGLVSRWAIEKAGASDTAMLVMFGTPNDGIPYYAMKTSDYAVHKRLGTPTGTPAILAMTNTPTDVSLFLHSLNDSPASDNTAYYTICGDVNYGQIDNNTDPAEDATHAALWDGPDDGVVYVSSARGLNADLANHCRGGYDDTHNLILHVVHSNVPEIGNNPPIERQVLGQWIREADTGNVAVTVQ